MEKQDSGQVLHVNRKSVLELQNHVKRNDRWRGVAEQCCSNNVSSPKCREEGLFSKRPSKGNLAVNKILGLFTILVQLEVQIESLFQHEEKGELCIFKYTVPNVFNMRE